MSLLDILEFEAPLSRVEEILQNILGASNEVDPESRVEKLLQNLIEVAYEVDPDSRVELLLDNLLGGHNEVVPMSRVEMLIANALGESYDVVPQSRVEELLVLLAEQYAVEYKTVSGSVVSISDALEAPMKSLKVAIEPVQDLHGQESPYPAGGGKNLLAPSNDITVNIPSVNISFSLSKNVSQITVETSGLSMSVGYRFQRDDFEVALPAGTYYLSSNISNQDAGSGIFVFNADSGTILALARLNEGAAFTLSDTTTIRMGVSLRTSTVNGTYWFQLEAGSTATDYAPYENICPISGWTGAQVMRTGKNLVDVSTGIQLTNNNVLVARNTRYGVPFKFKNGVTYTISCNSATKPNAIYILEPYTPTAIAQVTSSYSITFAPTQDTEAGINFYWSSGRPSDATDILVEVGSTATEYEPYTGNAYNISWETEAGTVYSGTLDVVSGLLTVDKANIASYNGETLPGTWISDRDVYTQGAIPTTGAQVVYELAEPITYHLTPTEVRTLLGQNNVWADTGDVEVTYLTKKH